MDIRSLINIVAICGTGAFAGVMLNIGLTFGPYWRGLPPAEFLEWFRLHSHLIGRTIPLVLLPSLLGIVLSIWFASPSSASRLFWIAAFAALAIVLTITMVYHLPTNAAFSTGAVAVEDVGKVLDRWLLLHWLRAVFGLVATVAGIMALTR